MLTTAELVRWTALNAVIVILGYWVFVHRGDESHEVPEYGPRDEWERENL